MTFVVRKIPTGKHTCLLSCMSVGTLLMSVQLLSFVELPFPWLLSVLLKLLNMVRAPSPG